jgi:hypothetical protein
MKYAASSAPLNELIRQFLAMSLPVWSRGARAAVWDAR